MQPELLQKRGEPTNFSRYLSKTHCGIFPSQSPWFVYTTSSELTSRSMSKVIAFGWYGGKFNHLNWLLPLLPEATHYCEPFGGSAAVLLKRKPSPVETYNDIDGEVVNFFRVLRDRQEELIRAIGLTPFSREELRIATEEPIDRLSDLERSRRFFVRARQVRTGLAQTASEGRWAHCKLTSRAGMAGAVSRWLGSVEGLSEIVQRLLRVQIENSLAIDAIQRYDSEETLFYLLRSTLSR
jgi:DNA adenine methylase